MKKHPNQIIFPDPSNANQEGLLAYGGNLEPETLIQAYTQGIFPWYDDSSPVMWWSPDPRMILFPKEMKISNSLKHTLNSGKYKCSFDQSFKEVISQCARVSRAGQKGTWITSEMQKAYLKLHKMGLAHSVETWKNDQLIGGLYGISLGSAFFGESMFHHMPDASKVALYYLNEHIKKWDFDFIDAQTPTSHLKSMGAKEISRDKFLNLLGKSMKKPNRTGSWAKNF